MNSKLPSLKWKMVFQIALFAVFLHIAPVCALELTTVLLQSKSKEIQVSMQTPRSFGYSAGDVIQHRFDITIPPGSSLNTNHFPAKVKLDDWLDVLNVELVKQSRGQYRLQILYQVSMSVKTTQMLEIPGFPVSIGDDSVPIPAWRFSYHALIPTRINDANIALQPAQEPDKMPIQPVVLRMLYSLLAALVCLGYILWRKGNLRLWSNKKTPFQVALQDLKHLPEQSATDGQIQQAFRLVHTALNQTAGGTVLESKLDEFFDRHPELSPLKEETRVFFNRSRQIFYEANATVQQPQNNNTLKLLKQLCLRFDKLQRQR